MVSGFAVGSGGFVGGFVDSFVVGFVETSTDLLAGISVEFCPDTSVNAAIKA